MYLLSQNEKQQCIYDPSPMRKVFVPRPQKAEPKEKGYETNQTREQPARTGLGGRPAAGGEGTKDQLFTLFSHTQRKTRLHKIVGLLIVSPDFQNTL